MSETNRSIDPTLLERMSSEVAPEVSPLMRVLLANARRIAAGIILCTLGAAGYGVYAWHTNKQVVDAQNALGRILVLKAPADRLTKLEAFKTGAPAGVRPAVTLAIARAAMQAENYPLAATAWQELAADPKSPIYVTGTIGLAESLAAQGKNTEALATLEGASIPADSASVYLVNALTVDIAEKGGNIDKALAACDKIVATVAASNPEEATFWRQKAAFLRGQKNAS